MTTSIPAPAATAAPVVAPLTAREAEVLTLAAHGLADEQIARQLGLSVRTVGGHLSRLRRKLGAANRAHAVALGLHLGLITLTHPDPARPAPVVPLDEHARLAQASDLDRLWRLLLDAGPAGANPAILAGQVRWSRAWVYYHLRDWTGAGWVEPVSRGRWRAIAPSRFQQRGRAG